VVGAHWPLQVVRMARRAWLGVAGTVVLSANAMAQNADGVLLGTEAALTGGAVLATAHDPAGAYYNPAGLAALPAATLQVSGSAYQLQTLRLSRYVNTTLPWERVEQTVQSTDYSAVPSVGAFGYRLSPRAGAALGVWLPAHNSVALVSDVHRTGPFTAGGSTVQVDYTQRIALAQRLDRTYFGAAIGLALLRNVRIGAAAFLVYQREETFFDLSAGALFGGSSPAQQGGTAGISVRGAPSQFALRLTAGVQWTLTPAVTVAMAMKTPAISLVTVGSLTTVFQTTSLLPGGAPSIGIAVAQTPPDRIAEPWRVSLGADLSMHWASVRPELDWQPPEGSRHGVLNARVGVRREVNPDVAWGFGLFTDRSRERSPSGQLVVDYYGIAAGVDLRPPPVRAARGPGATWDMRASVAVRYAVGFGQAQRLTANLFASQGGAPPDTAGALAQAFTVSVGGTAQF
jgi:hypothetical protein